MSLMNLARFVPLAVLAGLTVNLSPGQNIAAISDADGAIEYRLLATNKTSTMLKELNQAAGSRVRLRGDDGRRNTGRRRSRHRLGEGPQCSRPAAV